MNSESKKRILIVSGSFPPASGGPASLLANLIPVLIEKDFKVTVLTYGDNEDSFPYEVVRISQKGSKFIRIFRLIFSAFKLAKKNDLIYSFDVYWPGFAAFLASKLLRRSAISRFTGDAAWETASNKGWTKDDIITFQKKYINLKIAVFKKCRNAILKNCRFVITDSYFLRDLISSFGIDESRILVAHNAVEYLNYPEDFDKNIFKKNNQLKEKIILTVSRLVPWKGVDTVMDLLPELKNDFPEISFVCIGEGPEFIKLKNKAEKLSIKHDLDIRFLGNLPREEVVHWYLASDAYVLNTNYEGIAHTLLEALHFKTPIVTTRAGGNEEIIEHEFNGLLAEYNNQEQLYALIKRILSDADLTERLKENASKKMQEDFIWDRVIDVNLKAMNF